MILSLISTKFSKFSKLLLLKIVYLDVSINANTITIFSQNMPLMNYVSNVLQNGTYYNSFVQLAFDITHNNYLLCGWGYSEQHQINKKK